MERLCILVMTILFIRTRKLIRLAMIAKRRHDQTMSFVFMLALF